MRISLATMIGAGCAAALVLQATVSDAVPPDQPAAARAAADPIPRPAPPRTATLALGPLGPAAGAPAGRAQAAATRGLTARATTGYSLLGVSWDDPDATLTGAVQVRTRTAARAATRAAGDGWSGWRTLVADSEDRPDQGSAEQRGPRARGATAPLWVGPSDGVEVRVTGAGPLPAGLRVELVDPGDGPLPAAPESPAAPKPRQGTRPADHPGPRPGIVTRSGWGADESLRESGFVYTGDVRAVFVHHTDTGNDYACSDSPQLIRSIYQYHVVSNGWRDIGYNFLVDRCGTIYEGRAGGVDQPVLGAHTLGFNTDSSGVAALGTFSDDQPPQEQMDGIAKIAAWKLGLTDQDAGGTTTLTSANSGSRYPKGTSHSFDAISGHRDAFATDCPGDQLFDRLGDIRNLASHLQGRQ